MELGFKPIRGAFDFMYEHNNEDMSEADLGSAIILFVLWFGMLLVSGIKKKHLLILILILVLAFVLAWFFGFKDYQKARLATFFARAPKSCWKSAAVW